MIDFVKYIEFDESKRNVQAPIDAPDIKVKGESIESGDLRSSSKSIVVYFEIWN